MNRFEGGNAHVTEPGSSRPHPGRHRRDPSGIGRGHPPGSPGPPGKEGTGRRARQSLACRKRRKRTPGGTAHPAPPTALLCLLDDGGFDGEWIRLHGDVTIVGRTEGIIRIPHDGLVSGRHAEICRQRRPNGYRWVLADLQSTNGTFVRIKNTVLHNENEVIIGRGRYRFETGMSVAAAVEPPAVAPQTTQPWADAAPVRSLVPSLVEMSPAGPLNRFALTLPEYWIGRDSKTCPIARPDDVLVNARHARLYRDPKGQWHIENNDSLNGLWLRICEPTELAGACQFRMGEQLFIFRVT